MKTVSRNQVKLLREAVHDVRIHVLVIRPFLYVIYPYICLISFSGLFLQYAEVNARPLQPHHSRDIYLYGPGVKN